MTLLETFISRAQSSAQRIVLPEGNELRTLKAANRVLEENIAEIILTGNPAEILRIAADNSLTHIHRATIVDPDNHPNHDRYVQLLFELRKNRGVTLDEANRLAKDPLYLACLMIKAGDADGELAGARNTTGNVLRPALQIIRTLPGMSVVSGAMMLFTNAVQYGNQGMLMVADVAVMPNPTPQELADIAIATGNTMQQLAQVEPRIAMLSFSTKGSATHEMVDKVANATALAQSAAPHLKIDGELQVDAALVPDVGRFKAPNSAVAGCANVLIFPTLEAGNIGYKLVERLGNATAVGPVLQGMAAPVNDLSRGCSVEDIVRMIAITANQAISAKAELC
ncbi:MAG: phosphate acetyltransferase [Prevotellaceae bacterium]|jgi:phosphate acetyltransferase|nr:phosphate acetyltransferase [Prevotellaceae bacterium]